MGTSGNGIEHGNPELRYSIMDQEIKKKLLALWKKYFDEAELPITFYYSDEAGNAKVVEPPSGHRCLIDDLARVREGESLCFQTESVGCSGGKRYLGFTHELMPNFEYFLSCGIPGKLEGERYKKSPELVKEFLKNAPEFHAPAKYVVFKRWDKLEEADNPDVVIFFARPDVLSGLFTLANFDEPEPEGVFAPFAAGCGSIGQYPYLENQSDRPRCVLGMFDVSARPFAPSDTLTFAAPINKFLRMIEDMEESFLITSSWGKVHKRIDASIEH
jgi:uncharacterized protein (DUF169 family)